MSGPQCCENPPTLNPSSGSGLVQEFGGLSSYICGPADSKAAVILISDVFGICWSLFNILDLGFSKFQSFLYDVLVGLWWNLFDRLGIVYASCGYELWYKFVLLFILKKRSLSLNRKKRSCFVGMCWFTSVSFLREIFWSFFVVVSASVMSCWLVFFLLLVIDLIFDFGWSCDGFEFWFYLDSVWCWIRFKFFNNNCIFFKWKEKSRTYLGCHVPTAWIILHDDMTERLILIFYSMG